MKQTIRHLRRVALCRHRCFLTDEAAVFAHPHPECEPQLRWVAYRCWTIFLPIPTGRNIVGDIESWKKCRLHDRIHRAYFVKVDSTTVDGEQAPFKVIKVGAAVGGLVLPHSLDKAGIEYVVLDKHPDAPPWGASITIHTQSCRIVDQLGLLDKVESQCAEMRNFWHRTPDGNNYLVDEFIHFVNRR